MCSVHPGEPAVLQNVHSKTYHCDEECFTQSWREWMRDRIAQGLDQELRNPLWRPPHLKDQANHSSRTARVTTSTPPTAITSSTGPRGTSNQSSPRMSRRRGRRWAGRRVTAPRWTTSGTCSSLRPVPVDAASGAGCGAPETFTTGRVIPAPTPPRRNLVPVARHDGSEGGTFTVLTYNVLADLYATSEMYGYTPCLGAELELQPAEHPQGDRQHDADILCLQEVQSDHFEDFFAGELAKHWLHGGVQEEDGAGVLAGNVCHRRVRHLFKKDRFTLIKKYEVEFNKAALSLVESLGGSVPEEGGAQPADEGQRGADRRAGGAGAARRPGAAGKATAALRGEHPHPRQHRAQRRETVAGAHPAQGPGEDRRRRRRFPWWSAATSTRSRAAPRTTC